MTTPPAIIRFEAFTLDLANRQLRCNGKQVELGSRYFDALALLVAEAGSLVSKDRFMNDVWRGIPVTDEALTQCIRTLRKALGDDAGAPRFIQTVPKHGYRFLAAIGPEPGVVKEQASTPGHELAPSRVAGACTLAGAAAGSLGGLIYFLLAGAGGGPGLLALGAMVGALGMLAGAGIGLALGGALALRRKADFWLVPAGAAGGMMTGALGSTLAREGIVLLTGSDIGPVTGIFEGIVLGLAAGVAALLIFARQGRIIPRLVGAATIGGGAGAILHALGGNLLGGSLWELQQALGTSRFALEGVGATLGEASFGPLTHLLTAMAEGAVFIALLAGGVLFASPKQQVAK